MIERKIRRFKTPRDLAENLAIKLRDGLEKKLILKEDFYLSLSGGNTPKLLFNLLALQPFAEEIKWVNLHLFWGDERCVPPEDDESNYGNAKRLLMDKISIPEKNVHRIKGEEDPEHEVLRYADEINEFVPAENSLPRFDLILLGLGEDGHTASLFPEKELYSVAEGICGIAEKTDLSGRIIQKRISLTKEVICNAGQVLFLVTGKEKSKTLSDIINESANSRNYPASWIQNIYGYSEWWIDEEAASKL